MSFRVSSLKINPNGRASQPKFLDLGSSELFKRFDEVPRVNPCSSRPRAAKRSKSCRNSPEKRIISFESNSCCTEAQRMRFVRLQMELRLRPTATLSEIESSCVGSQEQIFEKVPKMNHKKRAENKQRVRQAKITMNSTREDTDYQVSESPSSFCENSLPSLAELEGRVSPPTIPDSDQILLSRESSNKTKIHQIENTCLSLQGFD